MGKKKSTTTSSQTNTISDFSRNAFNTGVSNVRGILNDNPFQAFEGERVAGLTDAQNQAQQQFQNGIGAGNGLLGQAADAAQAAGGFSPQQVTAQSFADADLSPFLNPFQQQVIDATTSELNRQRDGAINDVQGRATAANAFGGSRHGLVEAETGRNFADITARTVAGLNSDNFNNAANLFNQDAARQLQADQTNVANSLQGQSLNLQGAGLLGQLGQQQNDNNRADAALLNQFGQQEQQTNQAALDAQYQEFLRAQEDPFRRAQIEQGLLSATPIITNSSGTQTNTQSPSTLGLIGTGLQTASLFSDRRTKTDIEFLENRGEYKWYSYRYLTDAPHVRRTGVMADEVKAINPDAVSTHWTGLKQVNYGAL